MFRGNDCKLRCLGSTTTNVIRRGYESRQYVPSRETITRQRFQLLQMRRQVRGNSTANRVRIEGDDRVKQEKDRVKIEGDDRVKQENDRVKIEGHDRVKQENNHVRIEGHDRVKNEENDGVRIANVQLVPCPNRVTLLG